MIKKHVRRIASNIPILRQLLLIRDDLRQLQTIGDSLRRITWALEPHLRYQTMMQQERFYAELMRSPRNNEPKRLLRFEQQVFSQHGEDGILGEIFNRIGTTDRFFAEIGVGNGLENNTTYLLRRGWKGIWIDAGREELEIARREFVGVIDAGQLKIIESFISAANAAGILETAGVPRAFDLLSLDIDRNTYFLWEALGQLKPRVVVIEYNPAIPPSDDWTVEHDPEASWNGTIYFGASLKAYERLGDLLGYHLVGCDVTGTNAFFVRSDLTADKFCEPFTAENHYEPPRYFLNRFHSYPHKRRFDDHAG